MPKPNLKALGIQPKGRSISKKDFKMMKSIFIDYDKDNSGTVNYQEFVKAIGGNEGKNSKELVKSAAGMWREMDKDGNGEMTFSELLKAYYPACSDEDIEKTIDKYTPKPPVVVVEEKKLSPEAEEEMEGMFHIWDADNSGTVTMDELELSCSSLGIDAETVKEWFKDNDADGSGSLDIEEVKKLMTEFWPDAYA